MVCLEGMNVSIRTEICICLLLSHVFELNKPPVGSYNNGCHRNVLKDEEFFLEIEFDKAGR